MIRPSAFQKLPPYREAMARGDWERAVQLLVAKAGPAGVDGLKPAEALILADLHRFRGNVDDSIAILKRLAASPEPHLAAEALTQLAMLSAGGQNDPPADPRALIDQARGLAGGDKRLRGLVAHAHGKLLWKHGSVKDGGRLLEEARTLLEEAGAEEDLAKVIDSLAMLYEHRGERERALSCYSLSLAKKAQWRDLHGIGITLGNLGRFHLRLKEPALALSYLLDDLRIAETIGDLRAQVVVKINIGQARTDLGQLAEAQKVLEEALLLAREEGWRDQEVYALKDLARAAGRAGNRERAFQLLDAALRLLPEEAPAYPRGQVFLTQGDLLLELEELENARAAFQSAREIFSALGAPREEGLAVHGLARVSESLGEWNSCLYFLEKGMGLLKTLDFLPADELVETLHKARIASQERALPRSLGPYRILSRLGAGAFGEVYRGFDERPDAARNDVAVKVLRLEGVKDDAERRQRLARFRRECEILKGISHPNVVRLNDFSEEPVPYLVEEYIEGGDLAGLLSGGQLMPLDLASKLMRGILCGLEVIHQQGVVHRDLKPGNVLLRTDRVPVLADFGLARRGDLTALTLQSAVMGTLPYMAPEQLRGEEVDKLADIYAVGVLFFEMLSGRLPHAGNSLHEILRSLDRHEPADLRSLRPSLPAEITRCVMRCIEKDPERRYPSAAAILADLEDAVGKVAD